MLSDCGCITICTHALTLRLHKIKSVLVIFFKTSVWLGTRCSCIIILYHNLCRSPQCESSYLWYFNAILLHNTYRIALLPCSLCWSKLNPCSINASVSSKWRYWVLRLNHTHTLWVYSWQQLAFRPEMFETRRFVASFTFQLNQSTCCWQGLFWNREDIWRQTLNFTVFALIC